MLFVAEVMVIDGESGVSVRRLGMPTPEYPHGKGGVGEPAVDFGRWRRMGE